MSQDKVEKPWTLPEQQRLRELWASPLSAREIGAQMQRSKNSIVGRAHRLGLPARPSPIRPKGATLPPAGGERPAPTPAAVPKPAAPKPAPSKPAVPKPAAARPQAPPAPAAAAARVVAAPLAPAAPRGGCLWPLWGFGERPPRPPRFCEAPRLDGCRLPYCREHVARARRARDEQEDAA